MNQIACFLFVFKAIIMRRIQLFMKFHFINLFATIQLSGQTIYAIDIVNSKEPRQKGDVLVLLKIINWGSY
jgi:hypothetical protein